MKKQKKEVCVKVFGVETYGRNTTEAKAAAGKIIESLTTANFVPVVIKRSTDARFVAVVFRERDYYSYTVTDLADGVCVNTRPVVMMGFTDERKQAAVESAINDLAQREWKPENGLNFPGWLLTEQGLKDLQYWARFQLGFAKAESFGLENNECHRMAFHYYETHLQATYEPSGAQS